MNTRQQIIDATAQLITSKGLVGATTREIARAANCAEGTLYKHFTNKEELFMSALTTPLPAFIDVLERQLARAGEGELETNLVLIAQVAVQYYLQTIPAASAFFADPNLLERYQMKLQELDTGPQRIVVRVATYMQAEQRFARISKEIDTQVAAMLLIGPCFQYAYMRCFTGREPLHLSEQAFITDLVKATLRSIQV